MRRHRFLLLNCFFALALLVGTSGCGGFLARRLAQAPNTYPTWLAPNARVLLDYDASFLSNYPARYASVGPPDARLRYRVIAPADFHFQVTTNHWSEKGKEGFTFTFHSNPSGMANQWTFAPRGTVILLHGYGIAQFAMVPWALRLAEDGWRCVLVDLRGHGKSTGKRIFFGTRETRDLSQLLDILYRDGQLTGPVAVVGESYGGALALRWKGTDSRVGPVAVIAPYPELGPAVINIGRDYAGWVPKFLLRSALKKLPQVLGVTQADLDTTTVLDRHPVASLFIAGGKDEVTPPDDVTALFRHAGEGSRMLVIPGATHEAVTYFFDAVSGPVLEWLDRADAPKNGAP